MRGRVYDACVRSTMLYGSETWALKVLDEMKMERSAMRMIRLICRTKLRDRIHSEELRKRLGVEGIRSILRRRRLRWFGHIERKEDEWIKKSLIMDVAGVRPPGRPKKPWMEVVESDMKDMGLKMQDVLNRDAWRAGIKRGSIRKVRDRLTQGNLENGL